ncbi:FIST signal transduction protein [Lyngbya confervoides]|uniref:FIST C-terminal domain-containing protein n=1 Tax=Lyngbya confervoides BDU141951 TaxID=1574623 RepID=A0ABD4T9W8_9CYAN|nr:FIST N-terminal domain-containing protein [Lyngbya confervoides]MCM1985215.1 FIST C-terminal domain-containing protein [Lyngbya confervoides BDU141951]
MKWTNALSTLPSLEAALDEVIAQTTAALPAPPDLAILFISTAYTSEFTRVLPLLQEKLAVKHLIGCGGNGIIGQPLGQTPAEIEAKPAIALTLAHLPEVRIQTFHIEGRHLPDSDSPPQDWVDLLGIDPQDDPAFMLLADASTAKVRELLQGMDFAYPNAEKIGGLTSGSSLFGGSGLFLEDCLLHEGTIGVALSGNIVLDTIVAQGCRPIGPPFRVTEAERHIALQVELLGRSLGAALEAGAEILTPLEALEDLLEDLEETDRALAQQALSVGIASNEFKENLEPGDYLIRDLIGVDPKVGAIAIGDRIRAGQRIQFHLRDARASAEDIETLVMRYQSRIAGADNAPQGAVVFNCLGRGAGFYGTPNHDIQTICQYIPQIPITGFFCHGEIGPIGGSTYLHGYTASIGIFRCKEV